jgi:NitT/TauT family transport system permease protein
MQTDKKVRIPLFWGMYAEPGEVLSFVLGILPFILIVAGYLYMSHERNAINPDEKLTPTPSKIVTSFKKVAFEADVKTGDIIFWHDTGVSLRRLVIAASIASVLAFWFGMNMALFKGMNALLMPFLRFGSLVPPPILLPILFLTVGVEELSKVVIIVISIAPAMTLAMYGTVTKMAGEQITRSFTLGATQLDVVYKILRPQVIPRLIEILRTSLGMAWYSLILAEAVSASSGIGYRIFLVRRFTQMDVIIPYALWVVVIGYAINFILGLLLDWIYPWYSKQKEN